ncbi:MAG: T9SS type A sorting domain-containing protein [Saprospiraceae bacterium]|nr:T9SS type A sorting domain-containing protein [Saprospiraceae bacterium]
MKKFLILSSLYFCMTMFVYAQECIMSQSQIVYNYHTGTSGALHFQSSIGAYGLVGDCNSLDYTSIFSSPLITTGVKKVQDILTINLYPNPVQNQLILEWRSLAFEINFELLNVNGEILQKGIIPAFEFKKYFDTSDFPAGVYILKAMGNSTLLFTKKFTKIQ